MNTEQFFQQLDSAIAKYDLLCHPFYEAWAAGELTKEDLKAYAQDYYHHIHAFPTYLAELAVRLDESELRRAVLGNMADEKGSADATGNESREHADIWLDFAEGMGSRRDMTGHTPPPEIDGLMAYFHRVAGEGAPAEALATFYAYESQVPRVAQEKARGLREMYGSDEKTCGYFTLHATADVFHANVWKQQLQKQLTANPEAAEKALAAGEAAAKSLWTALDGIEARRTAKIAA